MEIAKENKCTVLLNGQGADELLSGYMYMHGYYLKELLFKKNISKLISSIYNYHSLHKNSFAIKSFIFSLLPNYLKDNKLLLNKNFISNNFYNSHSASKEILSGLYGANNLKQLRINHFENKLEHHLSGVDRSGMFFSLECRFPFLDHNLVQKSISLSSSKIISNGQTKDILRKAIKGVVPDPIVNRQDKIGFETPADNWFRTPKFVSLIKDIINSKSFIDRDIFEIPKLNRYFTRHQEKKINGSKEIWKWINLELWFRKYF